jgi:hypothetical protein
MEVYHNALFDSIAVRGGHSGIRRRMFERHFIKRTVGS